MKLTLMLMGGSALLMIGILGIYYQSGLHSRMWSTLPSTVISP